MFSVYLKLLSTFGLFPLDALQLPLLLLASLYGVLTLYMPCTLLCIAHEVFYLKVIPTQYRGTERLINLPEITHLVSDGEIEPDNLPPKSVLLTLYYIPCQQLLHF